MSKKRFERYELCMGNTAKAGALMLLVCVLFVVFAGCGDGVVDDSSNKSNMYNKTGYIRLNEGSLELDEFEFISQEDEQRISELKLTQEEMPNGYYINNPEEKYESFVIDDSAEFIFYDAGNLFVEENANDKKYVTSDINEFHQFLYGGSEGSEAVARIPFEVVIQDGKIVKTEEIFIS